MKRRRALAFSLAAVTALTSTSVCAFAEGQDSKELAKAITIAKTRLDIPEELSEFRYNTSSGSMRDSTWRLTWTTPSDATEYREISANVTGSVITSFYDSKLGWSEDASNVLAKLSGDELYKKAQALMEQINPTVAKSISIDRDSLDISLYNTRATFSLVRTKNGIPVANDRGTITLDKNTGALIRFSINWHEKAVFQDAKDVISEAKAKDKYADMIGIKPQYEFFYDWETKKTECRLVYRQSDFGEINAFTGKKSDFKSDGYYGDVTNGVENDSAADAGITEEAGKGDYEFTEQELAELDRELPYAGEAAIRELLQNNKYLTYKTDMVLDYSDLYKVDFDENDKYYYNAVLTNASWAMEQPPVEEYPGENEDFGEDKFKDYQTVQITVDAESGQIINYNYYDTSDSSRDSYDLSKADTLAKEIAEQFAGEKFGEFQDYESQANSWTDDLKHEYFWGSDHSWKRYANDILVYGDRISVRFNADMKLTEYRYTYTAGDIPDPTGMLTAKQMMNKFWENNQIDMYYLARFNDRKTKTVLVYGTDDELYADAFTGEQVYKWRSSIENDLSGIKDKKILKMAQKLDDHGFIISEGKFSENDPAAEQELRTLLGRYLPSAGTVDAEDADNAKGITRGEALVIFTESVCGKTIPELKGIYRSPFSDVSDDDKNIGYYAIAYGMGIVSGDKLDPDGDFTYGDMIKMVYTLYSAE